MNPVYAVQLLQWVEYDVPVNPHAGGVATVKDGE
jgi:hypothetical protein